MNATKESISTKGWPTEGIGEQTLIQGALIECASFEGM
jgi:hypothetical protein